MSFGPVEALCFVAWAGLALSVVQSLNRRPPGRDLIGGLLGQVFVVTAATLTWASVTIGLPWGLPGWLALAAIAWLVFGILPSQWDVGPLVRRVATGLAMFSATIIVIASFYP